MPKRVASNCWPVIAAPLSEHSFVFSPVAQCDHPRPPPPITTHLGAAPLTSPAFLRAPPPACASLLAPPFAVACVWAQPAAASLLSTHCLPPAPTSLLPPGSAHRAARRRRGREARSGDQAGPAAVDEQQSSAEGAYVLVPAVELSAQPHAWRRAALRNFAMGAAPRRRGAAGSPTGAPPMSSALVIPVRPAGSSNTCRALVSGHLSRAALWTLSSLWLVSVSNRRLLCHPFHFKPFGRFRT